MIKLKVIGEVQTRTVNRQDGSSFQVREQPVVILRPGEEYPDKGVISVEDSHPGWEVGKEYWLHPDSFYFDRYGKLAIKRAPVLQLVGAKQAAA